MMPQKTSSINMHPDEIWKLLGLLSPRRLPLPWDTKVERLLNGLKDPHLYIGRILSDRQLWLLERLLLRSNGHVLGGPGSGKTSRCVVPLITQLIAQGDSSIVVFDMKGDGFLFWTTFIEAVRTGLPFRWMTIEPGAASFTFNPLTQMYTQKQSANARAQSLLMSLGLYLGDAYRKSFYESVILDTLTAFLDRFRDIQSFADLAKYADARASYTATNTDYANSQQLRMWLRQLAPIEALNVNNESLVQPEVLRDAIDMTDVLSRKQVVFFSLPLLNDELIAKSVCNLGLYSITHAAKALKRTSKSLPCYTFVDDMEVCGETLKTLLKTGKSMGISLVLSHEDMSQLKTPHSDDTSTVEICTTFKLCLDASSLTAMMQMKEYSGDTRERMLSWTQPIYAGFDENSDDALSPDRAYARTGFDVPTANVVEAERSGLTKNEILAISAHPLQGFVRSRSDSGLTQYRGQWTGIECEYCTTKEEYEMRFNTPLPSHHPSCVTVGLGNGDGQGDPTPRLPNDPLPVKPPPKSVDEAIADRLQELQDRIRTEHLEKNK